MTSLSLPAPMYLQGVHLPLQRHHLWAPPKPLGSCVGGQVPMAPAPRATSSTNRALTSRVEKLNQCGIKSILLMLSRNLLSQNTHVSVLVLSSKASPKWASSPSVWRLCSRPTPMTCLASRASSRKPLVCSAEALNIPLFPPTHSPLLCSSSFPKSQLQCNDPWKAFLDVPKQLLPCSPRALRETLSPETVALCSVLGVAVGGGIKTSDPQLCVLPFLIPIILFTNFLCWTLPLYQKLQRTEDKSFSLEIISTHHEEGIQLIIPRNDLVWIYYPPNQGSANCSLQVGSRGLGFVQGAEWIRRTWGSDGRQPHRSRSIYSLLLYGESLLTPALSPQTSSGL